MCVASQRRLAVPRGLQRRYAVTLYHPVGTCRIGATAADSVVDAQLRVHGVHGVRVADCSVFPHLTTANTNAPAMMVGYRLGLLLAALP